MAATPLKILIVDDSAMVRMLLKNVLNTMGYKYIIEAENGMDAWQKLQNSKAVGGAINLVFCDANMPVMDGMQFLQQCRTSPDFKTLPVVMVTGNNEADQIKVAIAKGATNYIVKPFTADIIESKLKSIIEKAVGAA
jgi:two-component system, chemotaxis family, chemotaxis protein CheY